MSRDRSSETPDALKGKEVDGINRREKFLPENAKEHVERLIAQFRAHCNTIGYKEVEAVTISSGIDPTVRFIGSHISVLKPFLSSESEITPPGVFMTQGCLRTRNVDRLLDDSYYPKWGSYFMSLGLLSAPERLDLVCSEIRTLFFDSLLVDPKDFRIRISSTDEDLSLGVQHFFDSKCLDFDTMPNNYYRHQIGMPGLQGRNFNIALRDYNTDTFSDVGNVIILERDGHPLCIELALGVSTVLKQLYNLDHVLECTPVIGLELINDEPLRRKFEDAIITCQVLFSEGLRPLGQHNRNRILKRYLKSLSYFRCRASIDHEHLYRLIRGFEEQQLLVTTDSSVARTIVDYVKIYENELKLNPPVGRDDIKIARLLSQI
jgi:hypothetical protein